MNEVKISRNFNHLKLHLIHFKAHKLELIIQNCTKRTKQTICNAIKMNYNAFSANLKIYLHLCLTRIPAKGMLNGDPKTDSFELLNRTLP